MTNTSTFPGEEVFKNREAQCFCGAIRQSRPTQLALLEFRGLGSRYSMLCRICGESHVAHAPFHPLTGQPGIVDHDWVANGAQQYDAFYCGCREEDG